MAITSYTSIDHTPSDIVPVIASFDAEGHIAPLYVRIDGNALKIESYWASSIYRNVVEFRCKVSDNGYLKPLLLCFHRQEGMWTIPR